MSADFVGSSASSLTSSVNPVPLASGILGIGLSELTQHTERLQNATNENQAADLLIPAYDADLKAIAAAYNNGSASAAQCIAALEQVDTNCYNYLRAQTGKPGTAWTPGAPCGKSCTVGCCIYYGDLHPGIYGAPVFAGGTVGFIPVLKKGGGTVYVPEVYPPSDSSYGNYSRPSYTLQISTNPPKGVAQQALSVSNSGAGPVVNTLTTAPASASVPVAPTTNPIIGLLTNTQIVTIIGAVGGILLIIAYLFGSDAVRVNK